MGAYVIGLDYGTDSVRAVLLDTLNGEQLATSVHYYQRWKSLAYCNPIENQWSPIDFQWNLIEKQWSPIEFHCNP